MKKFFQFKDLSCSWMRSSNSTSSSTRMVVFQAVMRISILVWFFLFLLVQILILLYVDSSYKMIRSRYSVTFFSCAHAQRRLDPISTEREVINVWVAWCEILEIAIVILVNFLSVMKIFALACGIFWPHAENLGLTETFSNFA